MSRNTQAFHMLKECISTTCHLRNDEINSIFEHLFRHLNHDDDDTSVNRGLNPTAIKVNEMRNLFFFVYK